MQQLRKLHLHGIAVKPGKPTLFGKARQKPLIGLPGHPVAAYFIDLLFADPLLRSMMGEPPPCPVRDTARF